MTGVVVQELGCEPGPCRFNSDRSPGTNIHGGKFLWEGSLIVYQVAAGSTPVAIAFKHAAFDYWLGRLLLRQQEGDRNSYAVLASIEATKRRGRF